MTPAVRAIALLTAGALVSASAPVPKPVHAQSASLPIIRDAEIEQLLRDYVQPILRVAGLAAQNVKAVILNDQSFNAFVMDGRHIFINSGALFDAKTPNEVIGVLAHETGHLAGGHLLRLREELARAQTQSIIAMLLGIGAMIGTSRVTGGGTGAGGIIGPQESHSPLAARVYPHPRRPGRPRRREIPHRGRPIAEGHV